MPIARPTPTPTTSSTGSSKAFPSRDRAPRAPGLPVCRPAARWPPGKRVLMCYTNDPRPPLPPIMGGSTDEGDLFLTAADGNRFRAYAARAATPSGAAVVIIPDPRGVHPFYKDLVRRFAQAGVDAGALDYPRRTAGMSERGNDFDYRTPIGQTKPETIARDVAARIAELRSPAGGAAEFAFPGRLFFCRAPSLR